MYIESLPEKEAEQVTLPILQQSDLIVLSNEESCQISFTQLWRKIWREHCIIVNGAMFTNDKASRIMWMDTTFPCVYVAIWNKGNKDITRITTDLT